MSEDNKNNEEFIKAAKEGRLDDVIRHLENKVDVDAMDRYGATALMWASLRGRMGVVDELIKANANINKARPEDLGTALTDAAYYGHVDVVATLCLAGADVNVAKKYGRMPNYLNTYPQTKKEEESLNDNMSGTGWTAVMIAAFRSDMDCVEELVKWGAPRKTEPPSDYGDWMSW